ncbi:hypothetical protein BUALT_Bualt18G0112800 [Buddleja alternifolia]|uniref:Transposase n=1 Tax=Buddleja alternifolia TaxID=168488 RepID=A0AAV6WF26_9LAMI|nr:hypothetical protein BUALT_Bualt18G0112800 [Buddleja alternifolia]
MAGNVFLRTNRFEVKLEGITFKTKDFETLCKMDFLFPDGKIWDHPPIVGLDVMRHPRDPSILLVLLCFGVGCVILRLGAGEPLSPPIHKFLSDKRIHFVGFGIPEKDDLFPFKELGLRKHKVDIGYLAAKSLNYPKCKKWELAELARKVLGIKRMVGLTESLSFERHEQIKCAICQLFITSVIAMGLMRVKDKKKMDDSIKKSAFMKNVSSNIHLLAEGWFKLPKGGKKRSNKKSLISEEDESVRVHIGEIESMFGDNIFASDGIDEGFSEDDYEEVLKEGDLGDSSVCNDDEKGRNVISHDDSCEEVSCATKMPLRGGEYEDVLKEGDLGNNAACDEDKGRNVISLDDSREAVPCTTKMPLKGILKYSSSRNLQNYKLPDDQVASPSTSKDPTAAIDPLKRANSKGCNVSFKCR